MYTITLKSEKSHPKVTLTLKIGKKTFKAKTNSKGKVQDKEAYSFDEVYI